MPSPRLPSWRRHYGRTTGRANGPGFVQLQRGDFDGAIPDFNRAIELDPKFAMAFSNRAGAKSGRGDLEGAIADCTRALELKPNNPSAYQNRAVARMHKGDLGG